MPISAILFGSCHKQITYEECILQAMPGVSSDAAAESIKRACESRYSVESIARSKAIELSSTEISLITGTGRVDRIFGTPVVYFNIYNMNKNIEITEITVEISSRHLPNAPKGVYAAQGYAKPSSAGDFQVYAPILNNTDVAKDWVWTITGAKGAKRSWW